MRKTIVHLVTFFCLIAGNVFATITLPAIIADHAVLKQKSVVPLWGTETPGVTVTVETGWNNKKYTAIADNSGNWKVSVETPSAGGPYSIRFSGENQLEINDILIGEVWLSAGQSNMEWNMNRDSQAETTVPNATNNQIRLFKVKKQKTQAEVKTFADGTAWKVCSPEAVRDFSAMTYYFAEEMQKKLNVPIGVINASWGGTPVESWISTQVIMGDTELQKAVTRWNTWKRNYKKDSLEYAVAEENYNKSSDVNKPAKPKMPQSVYMMTRKQRQYGVLYNGMIAPCVPYALSGILWYQGTSNVEWADEYEHQLNSLIETWRTAFNNPNVPVIVGQLTAYRYSPSKGYAMRMAQLNQRKLPYTYVFCSMDLGDNKDVHPPHKQPYGERFAGLALNKVYGKTGIACLYPICKSIKAKKDKLVISFENNTGLYIKGEELEDITIAGEDDNFVPARAEIKGGKLIVYSPDVPNPKQVRYLYNNTPCVNILYNKDKLPAFPFKASLE